jgi:CHAD domain-containing protein
MLHAIDPESTRQSRRVLKLLKPVRTAAGRVRDMDVLIAKAAGLSVGRRSDGITRLVEHMSAIRIEDTGRLYRSVKHCRKKARSALKHCLRRLKRFSTANPSRLAGTSAPPEILTEQLVHWPRLQPGNLHEFRKGVKELRYMLQLVPHQNEHRMIALTRVKNAAGEWHDWLRLEDVAESVLDPQRDAVILSKIRNLLQEQLRTALSTANQLRKSAIELPLAA